MPSPHLKNIEIVKSEQTIKGNYNAQHAGKVKKNFKNGDIAKLILKSIKSKQ